MKIFAFALLAILLVIGTNCENLRNTSHRRNVLSDEELNDPLGINVQSLVCHSSEESKANNAACSLYCVFTLRFQGGFCNEEKVCICRSQE